MTVVVSISDAEDSTNVDSPHGQRRASVTRVTVKRFCSKQDVRVCGVGLIWAVPLILDCLARVS